MARVKSTARSHGDGPVGVDKGCNSTDLAERTESVHVSYVVSQSHVEGESDGLPHLQLLFWSF
jgi:hypothetical protein